MERYLNEIEQLRRLGFAEGLPFGSPACGQGTVARLESGRIGIAVEFLERPSVPTYSIIALDAAVLNAPSAVSDRWDEVVRDIHRRMPPNDD